MDQGQQVTVPIALLQRLAPLAEQMGIEADLPGITRIAPTIDVGMPIRTLALELGQLLSRQLLFVRGEDVVTVDAETGDVRRMSPMRFCGWIEEFCAIRSSGRSQRTRDSLTREDAAQILEQDIFRGCLRPLEAVHTMRLPVLRADGSTVLLEPGYDAESKIYTVELLKYEQDWTIDQAHEWLELHGQAYPWAWPEGADEANQHLKENRSWAVQVFAMLGVFCKAMFKPRSLRPMITYIGNQPGTGKSTLVAMDLMPVFGHASTTDTPKTDENMAKTLETVARTRQAYLFLDDVRYGLDSAPLNRFITSSSHSGRCMGGNSEMFLVDNVTQVFATGNALKTTSDLMRRSLIVELFLAAEVQGRKFDLVITPQYLAREEIRSKFLSALWALVRNYDDQVKEMGEMAEALRFHPQPLASFEDFSGLIGQMVIAGGLTDPLKAPEIAPNENEDDMRALLIRVATEAEGPATFDRKALVEFAREFGLLESLVGTKEDGELDSKSTKRWGRQLQAWRGRELVDGKGRRFRFAHKRQKTGATYPLTFL
jgi:hypothetical protein